EFYGASTPAPHLGLELQGNGKSTRVWYIFKDMSPRKLQKLSIYANAVGLRVGLWYKSAAEPVCMMGSAQYDWFAPATFGTFKNYYFAGLPHFADSVYTEWGNTYSVVCLETTGNNYAWLKYMQCWGF